MKRFGILVSTALATVVALGVAIAANVSDDTVTINQPVFEDLYAAGNTLDIQARVEGDLVMAGRDMVVGAEVQGDVLAAGETVRIDAPVADDVRMAGRLLAVTDAIGGHLVAAGETIRLGPDSDVADWAWLAGRNLDIQGNIGPGSKLAGRTVTLSGAVSGNLTVHANQLILTPTARINGNLDVHTSKDPQIDNEAQIAGELKVHMNTEPEPIPEWEPGFGLFGALIAIVTAVILYLLFPAYLVAGADRVKTNPLTSFGLGILALLGTPLIVALLFMTGLGAVLGLALVAIYLLTLLFGTITGSVLLASLGLRLTGKEESAGRATSALAVALAVVFVQLVQMIPVAGMMVTFLLFLVGLGAAIATAWRRYREA